MGRTKTLGKNVALIATGNSGSKLIGLLMMPFYTRWLSPEEFGTADMIFVYVSLLLDITVPNIGSSIFIFPKGENKEKQCQYFTSGLLFVFLCLFISSLLFSCIDLFSLGDRKETFFNYHWHIFLLLTVNILQTFFQQFTRAIDRMDLYSFAGLVSSFGLVAFAFILIPAYGIKGYILSLVAGHAVSATYSFGFSKSYRYFKIESFDKGCLKEMLIYSIPLLPNAFVWWLISSMNRPLMEQYAGLAAIGLLAVANKFPSVVNMVFGFFQQAWIVTVLDEFKKPDFGKYYNKMLNMVFLVQITLVFALIYLSIPLIRIFATDEYYSAWIFVPVLSLAVLFTNISAFTGSVFSATRKSKYYFYSSAVGAVVAVILNFLLIPVWQIWGACISILTAHMASAISRILFSSKFVKIKNASVYIFALISLLIAYLTFVIFVDFTTSVLVGIACYGIVLWMNKDVINLVCSTVLSKLKL